MAFWVRVSNQITREGRQLQQVDSALKKLASTDVLVGVPQESPTRSGDNITNAELVYIHTHGVRSRSMREEMQTTMDEGTAYSRAFDMYIQSKGSPIFAVPPRPIIEPALDREKDYIAELLGDALDMALAGNEAGMMNALKRAGMEGQNIVKDWFTNPENSWDENSKKTIKSKGSEQPLIDTGALRDSIAYVIRPKGGGRYD